jgi:hypothetical protein
MNGTIAREHISYGMKFLQIYFVRRIVAGLPSRRPGFELGSGHVGFVVDKAELG